MTATTTHAGTSTEREAKPGRRVRGRQVSGRVIRQFWLLPVVLIVWDLTVRLNHYNVIVMPSPGALFSELFRNPAAFAPDTGYTMATTLAGLFIGTLLGLVLAVSVWWSKIVYGLVQPVTLLLRTVPVVVFIPVLARVFGYDSSSVIAVTSVVSLFPAFVWTLSGLQSTPAAHRDLFEVSGSRRVKLLTRLALPCALPSVAMALRISAPTAVVGALLGEYLVGEHGLGHLFAQAMLYGEPLQAWAAAVIATLFSVSLYLGAGRLERWVSVRFS